MKVGIIGSGVVAQSLASGFLTHGHEVMLGTRDSAKLAAWRAANPRAAIGSVRAAAAFAQLVVLAVKGTASAEALRAAGAEQLAGKPVIDATNPIKDAAPVHGVLQFFTTHDEALMERLQREFPAAQLVKAFSSVGNTQFVSPRYQGGRPTMFICGNEPSAKATVTRILDQFGWETADMGRVEAARAIEPLCMLWCIQGFLHNEWTHAFKVLHAG